MNSVNPPKRETSGITPRVESILRSQPLSSFERFTATPMERQARPVQLEAEVDLMLNVPYVIA